MLSYSKQPLKIENVYFFINIIIFRHLELEIALAVPATNEWKIVRNDSAHKG